MLSYTSFASGIRTLRHSTALLPYKHVNIRCISTLDKTRLQPSDFIDFSGKPEVQVPVRRGEQGGEATLYYRQEKHSRPRFIPFPPGTSGFLYFIPGPPHAPIAGEVRLRVTRRPSPEDFEAGHDLLVDGLPWRIVLSNILRSTSLYRPLADFLMQGERPLESLTGRKKGARIDSIVLHSFGQPFEVDMSKGRIYLSVAHQWKLYPTRFRSPWALDLSGKHASMYKGL